MIKFKQKMYVIGLGNLLITALGMKQANDAEKQNEELAEQSRRDNAKTRAALEKLANSDASPETKSQAASLFSDLRAFAAPGGVLKNLGGLAKDMWKNSGSGVKNATKLGAGFAATGYLGNRLATSIKDHNEGNDKKNLNFLAKAALGAATIGGGIMAAKSGRLDKIGIKGAQNFMTNGYGKRALTAGKNILKENVSPVRRGSDGKLKVGFGGVMNAGFIAAPTISYLAQRKSQGDMVDATQQDEGQRQYAFFNPAAIKEAAKRAFNKKTAAQTWSGGFNKLANFIGMTGGKGGTKAVQDSAKNLGKIGRESGNIYTQKLAKWAQENPVKANLAAGVGTMAVGGAAMSLGGKAISKPMKVIDKDAYKMEEQENDKI